MQESFHGLALKTFADTRVIWGRGVLGNRNIWQSGCSGSRVFGKEGYSAGPGVLWNEEYLVTKGYFESRVYGTEGVMEKGVFMRQGHSGTRSIREYLH